MGKLGVFAYNNRKIQYVNDLGQYLMIIKIFAIATLILDFFILSCNQNSAPEINVRLMFAIKSQNLEEIKAIIFRGIDLNIPVNGRLPLLEAIKIQNDNIFKFLIQQTNLNINLSDSEGNTALLKAASICNIQYMKLLKEKNADFNFSDAKGDTALFYTILNSNYSGIEFVLKNNVDILHRNKSGDDALAIAIRIKNVKILKLLLTYGAVIEHQHLFVAYKLFCSNSNCDLTENKKLLIQLLEDCHPIEYNVDYSKSYKMIQKVISEEFQLKIEFYNCGIIKIFRLTDNHFLKAIGNIQFFEKAYFASSNTLTIKKLQNLEFMKYRKYFKFLVNSISINDFLPLSNNGFRRSGDCNFNFFDNTIYPVNTSSISVNIIDAISNNFSCQVHECNVRGFSYFDFYNRSEKSEFIWVYEEFAVMHNLDEQAFGHVVEFTPNHKYFMIYFPDTGGPILLFNVSEQKLILAKQLAKIYVSAKFSSNNREIVVQYIDRTSERFSFH